MSMIHRPRHLPTVTDMWFIRSVINLFFESLNSSNENMYYVYKCRGISWKCIVKKKHTMSCVYRLKATLTINNTNEWSEPSEAKFEDSWLEIFNKQKSDLLWCNQYESSRCTPRSSHPTGWAGTSWWSQTSTFKLIQQISCDSDSL